MFGIGGFELFIILIFGFLIFGPDKLPEIAKTVGKGIARFREAQQEMNDTLGGEKIFDPNNPDEPFKDPVEVLDRIAQRQEDKKAAQAGKAASTNAAPTAAPAAATAAPAAGSPSAQDGAKRETFTERKARYERERAARHAAEAEATDLEAAPAAPSSSDSGDEPLRDDQPVGAHSCAPAADSSESAPETPANTEGAPTEAEPPVPEGGDA